MQHILLPNFFGCKIFVFKDIHEFCKSYDSYQKIGRLKTKSLAKLVTRLPKEPFMKWGLIL